tara:strand:- start:129 stop:491 length:363 start_codon:yes stop_codon:yes gene_type:complete
MGHIDKLNVTTAGLGAIKNQAAAASVAATTAGDGTCTLSGTDLAGTLTFANTWADSDTAVVTFGSAKDVAPLVMISHGATINASGAALVEIDTLAITTAGFTITASGTCVGTINYLVIEQ